MSALTAVNPIRIGPVRLTQPIQVPSFGRPTATSPLDRRFATGIGRTVAKQIADAKKRQFH